jgi:hypothetical protein
LGEGGVRGFMHESKIDVWDCHLDPREGYSAKDVYNMLAHVELEVPSSLNDIIGKALWKATMFIWRFFTIEFQ